MIGLPSLSTRRLLLRPFTLADAPDVQRLAGDLEIAENSLHLPHPYEDGMAERWIGTHRIGFAWGDRLILAVTHRNEKHLIGTVGLGIERDHDRAELGYWIGRPYWNRGYATEAVGAIIGYGFQELGLNRIHALHFSRNTASGRVMQKVGMAHEGRLRQHVRKWGVYEDVEVYGVVREEYDAARTPAPALQNGGEEAGYGLPHPDKG
ncbi:MAG: GNAT family N-acetyltransferase [Methanomicrobiaceae archaeon]|nr:GNAT family N-acetyltransferase [Methanomicrobiaceae archaeon]